MQDHPATAFVVVIAFVALVYAASHGRAPDKGTQVALKPTSDTYLGVRSHDDRPDSTITVTSPTGDSWGLSLYAGGVPYQERDQQSSKWTYSYTVHRYPIDFDHDFGAWAGFRVKPDTERGSGLDMGIRYSPVRFVYGVVSPDILVSPNQAGIGVSLYPPSQTVNRHLQHFGVGVGYMADYAGGHGWVPYLALSTRF